MFDVLRCSLLERLHIAFVAEEGENGSREPKQARSPIPFGDIEAAAALVNLWLKVLQIFSGTVRKSTRPPCGAEFGK
jgi:hypothetical protein